MSVSGRLLVELVTLLLNEKRLNRLERFFFWAVVLMKDVVVAEPDMFDVSWAF